MKLSTTRARVLTIAGVGLASVLAIGGTATAASLITAHDLGTGAANHRVIKDGSIHQSDLHAGVKALLHQAGPQGPAGPAGPAGAQGPKGQDGMLGSVVESFTTAPQTVANIGGSFATRSTLLGSFSLPAGTYLITSDGFFHSDTATSGLTRLQLAIRGEDGSTFGQDYGTCFTGLASATANREATCTTVRTVTVTGAHPQTIDVKAFGYADDQGSADSGKFVVIPNVSVIKVAPVPAASAN